MREAKPASTTRKSGIQKPKATVQQQVQKKPAVGGKKAHLKSQNTIMEEAALAKIIP